MSEPNDPNQQPSAQPQQLPPLVPPPPQEQPPYLPPQSAEPQQYPAQPSQPFPQQPQFPPQQFQASQQFQAPQQQFQPPQQQFPVPQQQFQPPQQPYQPQEQVQQQGQFQTPQQFQPQYFQQQQFPQQQLQQSQQPQQQQFQQQYGMQAPATPPPPAKKGGRTGLVVALVLLLIAGGAVAGVMLTKKSGGGGAGGAQLSLAWWQNAPSSLPSGDQTEGTWSSDGVVAVATAHAISAFALSSGTPGWTWQAPAGNQICAASSTTAAHLVVVGLGKDPTTCSEMLAVDMRTGKTAWSQPASLLLNGNDNAPDYPDIIVGTDRVYALDGTYSLNAFDLATGAVKWSMANDPDFANNGCRVDTASYQSGSVYANVKCDAGPATGDALAAFDAESGARKQALVALPQACGDPTVLNSVWATPKYVLVDCSDPKDAQHFRFETVTIATGAVTTTTLASAAVDPLWIGAGMQPLPGFFSVVGDTLYVETLTGPDTDGTDLKLDAVNLPSGTMKWSVKPDHDFYLLHADSSGAYGLAESVTGQNDVDIVKYAAGNGQSAITASSTDSQAQGVIGNRQGLYIFGTQLVAVADTANAAKSFIGLFNGMTGSAGAAGS